MENGGGVPVVCLFSSLFHGNHSNCKTVCVSPACKTLPIMKGCLLCDAVQCVSANIKTLQTCGVYKTQTQCDDCSLKLLSSGQENEIVYSCAGPG